MKRNTIKWRIFKYNILVIFLLIILTTIIFNLAVRFYMETDIIRQLNSISERIENTALQRGRDFFPQFRMAPPTPNGTNNNDLFRYYFMLERSLREPLSVLNADFILLDGNKKVINPASDELFTPSKELLNQLTKEVDKNENLNSEINLSFKISNTEYIAIVKPVSNKNNFGLGWIVIYSSLQKVNQLQIVINIILFIILAFSALILLIFSSLLSKKISAPFSSLSHHIKFIAERNFGTKINMQVDDELQEFVNNINVMSEKLETYDQAQKTFLQNASHELRTPLTSIQSYAEGIKYDAVDSSVAADVIIDESKRLTRLIEDLLYLSRLNTIEENYTFGKLNFNELINSCVERMNAIAIKNNINIIVKHQTEPIEINADEEKLSRAITNILSNCIRYAKSVVTVSTKINENNQIELTIEDDGLGFEKNEIPEIFERFYKGKKGNHGLGLAISKNVIEKHNGKITAYNSENGALFSIIIDK